MRRIMFLVTAVLLLAGCATTSGSGNGLFSQPGLPLTEESLRGTWRWEKTGVGKTAGASTIGISRFYSIKNSVVRGEVTIFPCTPCVGNFGTFSLENPIEGDRIVSRGLIGYLEYKLVRPDLMVGEGYIKTSQGLYVYTIEYHRVSRDPDYKV